MAYLLNYTRLPINSELYDPKLAYSMHLALSEDGKEYKALNHNSGVLFLKATENEDGSLNPKSLKNPFLFMLKNGTFGVLAIRTGGDGEDDEESKGKVILCTSKDLLEYKEVGFISLSEEYIEKIHLANDVEGYILTWLDRSGVCKTGICEDIMDLKVGLIKQGEPVEEELPNTDIEGVVPHNVIEVCPSVADRLRKKLLTPYNVEMQLPEEVVIRNKEELEAIKATAKYSDGTKDEKRVDWDTSTVDFEQPGTYVVKGRVHQDHFAFPIAFNRADPCITRWEGKYYFIATNDADKEHTLYIREADSIPELVDAKEHLILDSTTYRGIGGLLWAPEFHEVEGKLYIYHAATPGEFFHEESHVMELREGGNPICREDWSAPKRVVKADGSDICEAGKEITLDMTVFNWQGDYYAIWSQRQFLPKDLGAWLYIAKLDPKNPWKLLTEPGVLSKPDYGWANNHTFVDEGPFALIFDEKLYITFSSAAVDSSYVVGLLSIEKGKDLLVASNWKKGNYPLLTSRSVEGEFGTGHNAYVIDEEGKVWNTYHARPGVHGVRSSGIRRVHFDVDGDPVLDMTEEMDINPKLREVEVKVIIEK